MTSTLDGFSVLSLISAIVLYAIAFLFFALDLARRGAAAGEVRVERAARVPVGVGAGTTVADRPAEADPAVPSPPGRSLRIAMVATIAGAVLHLVATVLRGLAAERLPWANMYEFAMTGTLVMVAVFLGVLLVKDLRFLGTIVLGFVVVLLGVATLNFRVEVAPLPPALKSYWIVIHVFVAILATAFFFIGFALNVLQLLQSRSSAVRAKGRRDPLARYLRPVPSADTLENSAYRVVIIGFILWTFTLISGAVWAADAWGRYWGWDTKEVWTFIIWVIYAGYIHARATRGWRGDRSAWLSIIGFSAVLFNFGVVNVFFKGLHAYSGL